jgi:hypothetical protein
MMMRLGSPISTVLGSGGIYVAPTGLHVLFTSVVLRDTVFRL